MWERQLLMQINASRDPPSFYACGNHPLTGEQRWYRGLGQKDPRSAGSCVTWANHLASLALIKTALTYFKVWLWPCGLNAGRA